jgi:hypothetical protein
VQIKDNLELQNMKTQAQTVGWFATQLGAKIMHILMATIERAARLTSNDSTKAIILTSKTLYILSICR